MTLKGMFSLIGAISLCTIATPIFDKNELCIRDGVAYVDRGGIQALNENFEGGISGWTLDNFENQLTFTTKVVEGRQAFFVTLAPDKKECDTAWEAMSSQFAVTPNADFTIKVNARGTISMINPHGHKDLYKNVILWYDADGNLLQNKFRYVFPCSPDKWIETECNGVVPSNAVSARICIGGDVPNFDPGDTLAISDIAFFERDKSQPCVPEGSFTTGPVLMANKAMKKGNGPKLSWEIESASKWYQFFRKEIAVQIATAPDDNGIPGEWTEYLGPDGTANSFYTSNSTTINSANPWAKCKVTLFSNGMDTPKLKSISIGATKLSDWEVDDLKSPQLEMLTESPSDHPELPITFSLKDDSPINWHSLTFSFDGEIVTERLKRDGNTFSYQESKPFAAASFIPNPHKWFFSNYQGLLGTEYCADSKKAVRVILPEGNEEGDTSFSLISDPLPVFPGSKYSFTIRTRHSMKLKGQTQNASKIVWFDSKLYEIGKPTYIDFQDTTNAWYEQAVTATAPANAAAARLQIGFDTPNINKGDYFDLDEVKFNGTIPEKDEVKVTLSNLHTIAISGEDIYGNKFKEERIIYFGPKVKENIVTMRDDGFVLIDGKPFFPIGLYGMSEKQFNNFDYYQAFKTIRENGFNFGHTYADCSNTPRRAKFLDAAAANDVKVWVPIAGTLTDCILKERNHKAILAWYLGDDTSDHIPADEVRMNHLKCHALDNAHLTTQADPVGNYESSRYLNYVHSTDTFLPEIYPTREDKMIPDEVPQVICDMKTIFNDIRKQGSPTKSIWAIIQHFKGWGWKRFPTFDELRAMSYLSIIHGAHGITWYTYGGNDKTNLGVTSDPERWKEICTVAKELSSLEYALTARHAKVQPTAAVVSGPKKDARYNDSISCLLKDNEGEKILLTANSTPSEIEAEISLNGYKTAEVLFENRTLQLKDGKKLSDKFAPFAVHVYKLK